MFIEAIKIDFRYEFEVYRYMPEVIIVWFAQKYGDIQVSFCIMC